MSKKKEAVAKLRVWVFTDVFASMGKTQEEEYEEIQRELQELVPEIKLTFSLNKSPDQLSNASPDVYLFDIGGMCATDYGGSQRRNWCHMLMRQIDDHPNTLFIPWSSMTGDSIRSAMQEFLPEWDDPEAELPEPPVRFNVWLPPENERWSNVWFEYTGLAEKLRGWV